MTSQTQAALNLALQLDPDQRAALVTQLIASLDGETSPPADWAEAWDEELRAREAALRNGTAQKIPGDAALANIFQEPDR